MKHTALYLTSALCLAACSSTSLSTAHAVKAVSNVAASNVAASKAPAETPTATASPPSVLLQPAGTGKLAGTVKIDANYMIGHGGAQLLSNNGSSVLALASSGLIANNGGGLIANNGGGLIANNGGGVISDHGGAIVANNGGALIANNGGGAIALAGAGFGGSVRTTSDGSGILSDGGAGAVAAGGAGYHLTAVTPTTVGTLLPVAGMLVSAVDPSTNQYLSLGTDAQGKPVYGIYTGPTGAYTLYLPKNAPANVLVVASVPNTTDGRLSVERISAPTGAAQDLDEDQALLARYVRTIFAGRLLRLLQQAALPDSCQSGANDPTVATFQAVTGDFLPNLRAAAKAVHFDTASAAQRDRIIALMSNVLIKGIDLSMLPVVSLPTYTPTPGELATPVLNALLKDLTDHAATRLQTSATAFDPFVQETVKEIQAQQLTEGSDPCTVVAPPPVATALLKPSDLADFLVGQLVADGDTFNERFEVEMFEVAGLTTGGDPTPDAAEGIKIDSFLSAKTLPDPVDRPSFAYFHHVQAATTGLGEQLLVELADPAIQTLVLQALSLDSKASPAPTGS